LIILIVYKLLLNIGRLQRSFPAAFSFQSEQPQNVMGQQQKRTEWKKEKKRKKKKPHHSIPTAKKNSVIDRILVNPKMRAL